MGKELQYASLSRSVSVSSVLSCTVKGSMMAGLDVERLLTAWTAGTGTLGRPEELSVRMVTLKGTRIGCKGTSLGEEAWSECTGLELTATSQTRGVGGVALADCAPDNKVVM